MFQCRGTHGTEFHSSLPASPGSHMSMPKEAAQTKPKVYDALTNYAVCAFLERPHSCCLQDVSLAPLESATHSLLAFVSRSSNIYIGRWINGRRGPGGEGWWRVPQVEGGWGREGKTLQIEGVGGGVKKGGRWAERGERAAGERLSEGRQLRGVLF